MSTSTGKTAPTPERIFEALTAYQQSAALKGAIDLDLFTGIAEGRKTVAALAQYTQASERGLRILCDYLTVYGFLRKEGDQYSLTEESDLFLNRRSPACMASVSRFISSPVLADHFADIAAAVRKGGCVSEKPSVAPEHPMWMDFARAMEPMMAMSSKFMLELLGEDQGQAWKVLDIAASHGLFGINILAKYRNAEVVAVDWKNVLAVAQENAAKRGVGERHRPLAGSAFDVDWGRDFDLALVTNFLHHFDKPTCERFMKKVADSLKPGGRAIILEFVPNPDRVTPPMAAGFPLVMLASTPAGDAYTFDEFDAMLRNAGFQRNELRPVPNSPESLIISTK